MTSARRVLLLGTLTAALAIVAPAAAHAACTNTWLPTSTAGSWSTGTNWSSGSAPGATDDVCVPAGTGAITFDPMAASVRSLQLARTLSMNFGTTLTLTGSGTNNSQLTSPADVTGSATLVLGAAAQLSKLGAGTSTLTVDINLDGPVNIDAGTLALGIGSDTTDSNAGNFTLADGTTFAIGVGGFGTHVFGGTVTDGANSATVTNASGNQVTFNGTYSVETTSNAGNLAWNGTTTPDRVDQTGAGVTLGGSASYTIADSLTWSAGIIGGSGTTTLPAASVLDFSGAGGKTLARTLNNDSTTAAVLDASGFSIQDPGGLLNNRSGSTFRLSGDNDIGGGGDLASRTGSLVEKVGAGDASLTTDIDFDGPVEVDVGSLSLGVGSDSVDSNAGNVTLAQGTTLATGVGGFGTHVFAGTVTDGANSATVTNGSGNLVSFNGTYSVQTTSNSGNVAFNGTPTFGVLNLTGGTLGGSASWSAPTFNWSGGSLGGSGTSTIPAGATFALTTATAKNVIDTRVLRNETASFQPPADNTLSIGGSARLDNAGTLTFADDRDIGGGGTVRNLAGGTLRKTGGAGGSSELMLAQNAGTVSVSQGTLAPQTAYAQSGGQTVVAAGATFAPTGGYSQSAGTLRGGGTVGTNVSATGGTVAPGASPGTLTISGIYTQGAGATLQTEINGTTPGTGFDRLTAASANLDGTLAIVNGAGFTPALTDTFEIVDATSVSGTFDTLTGATNGSRRYDPVYNPADVTLTVSFVAQPQPPGDPDPDPKPKPPGNPILSPAGCLNTDATLRGKQLGPAKLGRKLAAQRAIFRGANQQTRANLDRYCAEGGGNFRIGYPTPRLNAKLSKKLARKVKGRVVIVLTSSKRFSLAGIEVGDSVADARGKLKREKTFKVGSNTWYVTKRGGARLLVKTKGGRVREIGIGDARLTTSTRATKRFLNAWKLQ